MDSTDYYNRYAIPYYEKTVDLSMEEILRTFIELLPENAEILDLGCGSGRDTLFLEEEGFSVTAMDGSEEMCQLASIHTGKEILQLKIEDMEFDDVFNGIWACAILGHFPPEEVKDVIKKIVYAVKEEGIIYFSVRKGDRNGIYNGRYFYDYDRESLRDLIDQVDNVELINLWRTEDVRKDSEGGTWYNVLLRKKIEGQ